VHGAVKHLLESFSLAGLPLLIGGTQIGRAALPRYFSLGKTVAIVGERPNTWRKRDEARRFRLSSADFRNGSNPALQQHCAGLAPGGSVVVGVALNAHLENDLPAIAARMTARTRAVYVVNPHNPTGTASEAIPFKAFLTGQADNRHRRRGLSRVRTRLPAKDRRGADAQRRQRRGVQDLRKDLRPEIASRVRSSTTLMAAGWEV